MSSVEAPVMVGWSFVPVIVIVNDCVNHAARHHHNRDREFSVTVSPSARYWTAALSTS
ncbi:MAG: hypothetical protein R3D29_12220 [Nitratireductor sp.]